jgi:hypothetical protein
VLTRLGGMNTFCSSILAIAGQSPLHRFAEWIEAKLYTVGHWKPSMQFEWSGASVGARPDLVKSLGRNECGATFGEPRWTRFL